MSGAGVGGAEQRDDGVDSGYAWFRLLVSLLICSIGSVGFWSVVVVLPAVEADFRVARADASLPYSATMIGVAVGGIVMGRIVDRVGILLPILVGSVVLGAGYALSAMATSLWQFVLAQGLLIGFLGGSATFAPLLADISHWFERHRGMAVSIVACGNLLAGTVWPPILQYLIDTQGWRAAHMVVAVFCIATLLPLAFFLRRRPPHRASPASVQPIAAEGTTAIGLRPLTLQLLLMTAGIACCVAMAMPQVHIVAYCGDLGHGVARGAEMLSLMLGLGIISRLASGFVADRIGGLGTLLIGSVLQMLALIAYLPAQGLTSLYVVSALFGLGQGGIVPSYTIIVRELYPPGEAATRVGVVMMAVIGGMAAGGWMSGLIFDLTGSYHAAFLNGIAWNVLNIAIVAWLLFLVRRRTRLTGGAVAA